MTRRSQEFELARISAKQRADVQANLDAGAVCVAARVFVPLLEELRPWLEKVARNRVPGFLRWLPGLGTVASKVVGEIIETAQEWADEQCESDEGGTE